MNSPDFVLLFGAAAIIAESWLIRNHISIWTPTTITRLLGLTIVVVAGVFLVAGGYDLEKSAPVLTILGSIAGYLIGRSRGDTAPPSQDH